MNTAIVNFKIDQKIKKQAQKIASELGLSLSAIINGYLKNFIRTKTVTFSMHDEEPSEYLIKAIDESEKDIKEGRVISFKSGDEVLAYLDKEIFKEKNVAKN